MLRQSFWIVRGAVTVRKILGKCIFCQRRNSRPGSQIMSDWPVERLTPDEPAFHYCSRFFLVPLQCTCCTRNRFLVISCRSAASIMTRMVKCDRSKRERKIHCCNDLWLSSAAFICEVIVTKFCRVQLWNSCFLVIVVNPSFCLSWIYVWNMYVSGTVVPVLLFLHCWIFSLFGNLPFPFLERPFG